MDGFGRAEVPGRTGRVADGWLPGHAADWHSECYRTSRPVIDQAAAAVGRDPREIRTVFNLPGRITDRPLPAPRDCDGRWIGGCVDQWVEELTGAVLEHGASGFMLFSAPGGSQDIRSLGRWAGDIVPAVREAITKVQGSAPTAAGRSPRPPGRRPGRVLTTG